MLKTTAKRRVRSKAILVYITVSSRKEADRLAQALVEEQLAACVSIVPEIYSRYWWKGRVEHGREMLLIAKTFARRYNALEKKVLALHSYSVPEILATPILQGNPDYLNWMADHLQ